MQDSVVIVMVARMFLRLYILTAHNCRTLHIHYCTHSSCEVCTHTLWICRIVSSNQFFIIGTQSEIMNEFGAHPEWQASECLTDKLEHTRCTGLPHNSLSPHWAHTPIGPPSTSTGTGGSAPLTCWLLLLLITFLTVTGAMTLHCITQVLSESIMFQIKEITHSTIVALKACMLMSRCNR